MAQQNEQTQNRRPQTQQPRWLREFLGRPRTIEEWVDGVKTSSEAYRLAGRVLQEVDFKQQGCPEPNMFTERELGILEPWVSSDPEGGRNTKGDVFDRLGREDRRPNFFCVGKALEEVQTVCNAYQVAAVRAMKALGIPFPEGRKFADVVRDFWAIVDDGLKATEKAAIETAGRLRRAGVAEVPTDKEIRALGDEQLLEIAGELGQQLKELLAPPKAAAPAEPVATPATPSEAADLGWDGVDVAPTTPPGTNGQPRSAA